MRHVALTSVFLSLALLPGVAQRIKTQKSDRMQIVRLKTALDHLTVIELGEPVLQVAAGSSAFKIEWRENKVFVQPTDRSAATNLFIWTASQRLNYELEPAAAVTDMDFAIEQATIHQEPIASPKTEAQSVKPMLADLLLVGQAIRAPEHNPHVARPVEVWIRDLYQREESLLVRYTVLNHGTAEYVMSKPRVFKLEGVRSAQSLYTLTNSQLDDEQASKLKSKRRIPVEVLMQTVQCEKVQPGQEATGVVSLAMTSSAEPSVFSFEFYDEGSREKSTVHPTVVAYVAR